VLCPYRAELCASSIQTFVNFENPSTQISVLTVDPSGFHPHVSVAVTDVDILYATAVAAGLDIV
jgi:hypothetical protein